ncbi:MAG: glycogen debranching protein, partial [Lachnospiraceae bacterium]|nr:glycogen debranching protein [Lachnospiraceae bacterium]
PLGAYYRARIRFAKDQKEEIQNVKEQLMAMDACIREGCVGQIAEIYDGDRPVKSKGCFAQAWSVGEILRVYDMIEKLER